MNERDMIEQTGMRRALAWHLQSNHYPPVPSSMLPVCLAAIDAARDGDWERLIDLPEPITWRDQSQAPVSAIVEDHHLSEFVISDDD